MTRRGRPLPAGAAGVATILAAPQRTTASTHGRRPLGASRNNNGQRAARCSRQAGMRSNRALHARGCHLSGFAGVQKARDKPGCAAPGPSRGRARSLAGPARRSGRAHARARRYNLRSVPVRATTPADRPRSLPEPAPRHHRRERCSRCSPSTARRRHVSLRPATPECPRRGAGGTGALRRWQAASPSRGRRAGTRHHRARRARAVPAPGRRGDRELPRLVRRACALRCGPPPLRNCLWGTGAGPARFGHGAPASPAARTRALAAAQ